MNNKGFTLIELIITLSILGIIAAMFSNGILNNRAATEKRARDNAMKYAAENNLLVSRLSCAGDSDLNGYGTCTAALPDGSRLMLQCPTDFFDVMFFGASVCKEVFVDNQLNIAR